MKSIARLLEMPKKSFFLFGARGVGKSTWLREHFSGVRTYNLLDQRQFVRLSKDPGSLKDELVVLPKGSWVVLDEIQRIPALLNIVHEMIEERALKFALSGSSARKLKRGGGNLLAGRAVTRQLFPFSKVELGARFDLSSALRWGLLPMVQNDLPSAKDILAAYFHTYIREEIREEGLIRKIDPFLRFLEIAGLLNGTQVSGSGIARDAMVSRSTVDQYFSVLEDTLIGVRLPAYQPRAKVREVAHPKFYWFDSGVARAAAGLLEHEPEREWLGRSLEAWLLHELRCYLAYRQLHYPVFYYRTKNGVEVDFVVEVRKATVSKPTEVICVEVKLASKWDARWASAFEPMANAKSVKVLKKIGIYTGDRRLLSGGVEVFPAEEFIHELHRGTIM